MSARDLPCTVSHVADFYRRYPGETVTFWTRVDVRTAVPGFTLRVHVPAGLTIADYRGPEDQEPRVPLLIVNEAGHDLLWQVETAQQPGSRWECQVQATLDRAGQDQMLASRAMLDLGPAGWEEETVAIAVLARGRYLSYLPAIYQDDDLMSRFLMLFESFWGPIDHQIANLALYLDPLMAPPEFVSWLATWLDLALDESWPDEKRRRLLQSAASLYRRRGTRQALIEYLEIYTGVWARVAEQRSADFRIGRGARLGTEFALGRGNRPHTFVVTLCLPPVAVGGDGQERALAEAERRRKIEAIIESVRPAHTAYELRLETTEGPAPEVR